MDNKHEVFSYEGQVDLKVLPDTPLRTADTFKTQRETDNRTDFTVSEAMNRLGSREAGHASLNG
jgi:hypothetical protein